MASAALAEPFGSPPGRPAKYVLYLSRRGDDDTQCMVVAFAAPYAARKFLDALIKDDGYVWEHQHSPGAEPNTTIVSETGIVVSTRWWPGRLKKCVDHDYSLPEMAWDLDSQHLKWARQFREGPDLPRTLEDDVVVKAKREKKAASAPRADAPPGYVHVSDVALSMGIDAKQARVALRKIYPEGRPAIGWWFDPATLDDLKRKIKEVLK